MFGRQLSSGHGNPLLLSVVIVVLSTVVGPSTTLAQFTSSNRVVVLPIHHVESDSLLARVLSIAFHEGIRHTRVGSTIIQTEIHPIPRRWELERILRTPASMGAYANRMNAACHAGAFGSTAVRL